MADLPASAQRYFSSGEVRVRGEAAVETRSARAVTDSSSIVHYLDPFTSNPGGIKRSLRNLGWDDMPFQSREVDPNRRFRGPAWLDPTRKYLRITSIVPATQFNLTYQHWPLTNGLMAKGWIARGLPSFYTPAVEPINVEKPYIENTNEREPNAYYYFSKSKIDIKPPTFQPDHLANRREDSLVKPEFEEPKYIDPLFIRPDFDLRGVNQAALKRYPDRHLVTLPGGLRHERANSAQPTGEQVAPQRRFRSASMWDVFVAKNDPRPGDDPEVVMETRRRTYYNANFEMRNPDERLDPTDPKPSYNVRPSFQPEFRRIRYPGQF